MTLQDAMRKARFGHRNWMAYRNAAGEHVVAPMTKRAIKEAMLAHGTKGHFTMIAASTGVLHKYGWAFGVGLLRNARHLGIPA